MTPLDVHLILARVTIAGTLVGLFLLAMAAVRRSREMQKLGLAALVVVSLAGGPAYLGGTGPLEAGIPGAEAPIAGRTDAALFAFLALDGLGLAALVGWIFADRTGTVPKSLLGAILALALAAATLMSWAPQAGSGPTRPEMPPAPSAPSPARSAREAPGGA